MLRWVFPFVKPALNNTTINNLPWELMGDVNMRKKICTVVSRNARLTKQSSGITHIQNKCCASTHDTSRWLDVGHSRTNW